jgi:DegV family protein with EDD domain
MRIAVVTDSTADIPTELTHKYPLWVIPTIMVVEGKSYEDDGQFTREEFYRRLPAAQPPPTTAAPAVGAFEQVYRTLLSGEFDQIISIHVASALSGVYNVAHTAAQSFGERITVLDSEQLSMGLGFQAINAARTAAKTDNIQAILEQVEETRRQTNLIAMLDTLEYVRRSGRVSWARAALGNLFRLKAFIEVKEGRVLRLGEARTRRKAIERLSEMLAQIKNIQQLAILHSNAEQDAHDFLAGIRLSGPETPYIVNVTPVIGTHVGPNALGFVAITAP